MATKRKSRPIKEYSDHIYIVTHINPYNPKNPLRPRVERIVCATLKDARASLKRGGDWDTEKSFIIKYDYPTLVAGDKPRNW